MDKFRLINIIGIDGAGKTTLAKNLADSLSDQDKKVSYCYCQYFAKLLYPVKMMAKLSFMRNTDEFKNYNDYNTTKKETSIRFPFLANCYAFIWLCDYILQVFFKVTIPYLIGKKLIIDRYIFDIAVNLSLTTGNDINYAERFIRFFLFFAPRPDFILFIDLPEGIAFSRKNDIQGIDYLKERRQRYVALSDKYNFSIIDGTKPIEQVLEDTKKILNLIDEK